LTDQFTPQAPIQPARPARDRGQVIGGALIAFAGLLSLPNVVRWAQSIAEYGFQYFDWATYLYLVFALIGGIALAPLAVVGIFINKKLVIFVGLGWVAIRLVAVSVVALVLSAQFGGLDLSGLIVGTDWEQVASFVSVFIAGGGALVALLSKSNKASAQSVSTFAANSPSLQPTGTAPGWYFDPSVGGQRYWDGSTWLNIPAPAGSAPQGGQAAPAPGIAVAALVLAIVMPLVGLIIGYVARNQASTSANPQAGASLIKGAITIGWIFTILGVVGSVIYGIAMATLLNQGYY
jgi:hypothetical protein